MTFQEGLKRISLVKSSHSQRLNPLVKGLLLSIFLLSSCRSQSPETPQKPLDTAVPNVPKPPPPPPTNSYLAHLSPDATNQLISLGIKIVIPTFLTPNMTLANHGAGETANSQSFYWLVYRDNQNRCFAIEYTSSDTEPISLENREPLNIDIFGNGYSLYHGKFPNGGEGELPNSDLFTDWLVGEDGFYRLIGAGLINAQDYGQGDCSNITISEAIAITESLSYLPTDIRTLDVIPSQIETFEQNNPAP